MAQPPVPNPLPQRLVIVDTCSLLRLYYTDVTPVAGRIVSNFDIRTLDRLAGEVRGIAKRAEYAWLNVERMAEVSCSVFPLTRQQSTAVEARRKRDQPAWQTALDGYCASRSCLQRVLSPNDGFALAAAIEFNAILATDEWPLKWVADSFDYDDGSPIESWLSVNVLALMEANGVIAADDRRKVYRAWRLSAESLHADSDRHYLTLFKEPPPSAQG